MVSIFKGFTCENHLWSSVAKLRAADCLWEGVQERIWGSVGGQLALQTNTEKTPSSQVSGTLNSDRHHTWVPRWKQASGVMQVTCGPDPHS